MNGNVTFKSKPLSWAGRKIKEGVPAPEFYITV